MSRLTKESADVVAQEAEDEIRRILSSWESRPTRITATSAVKLVLSHFRKGAAEVAIGALMKPLVSRYAKASWEDVREARDDMSDTGMDGVTMGLSDRLKDLEFQFGSPKNVSSYKDAKDMHHWRMATGQKAKALTSKCRHSRSKISWKDEQALIKLLIANLGNKLVVLKKFMTLISPAELAELIGLKLALKVQSQATEVEEVSEMLFDTHRINQWLERRSNMPQYEGDLNPAQLALPIEDRYKEEPEDDEPNEYIVTRGRIGFHADDVVTEVIEDVNSRFTATNEYEVEERYGRSGGWVISETTGKPIRHKVTATSSTTFKPLPEEDEENWDKLNLKIKYPEVYADHTQPAKDGEFPQIYEGPSFVIVRNGLPAKPEGRCTMHDGMLWFNWSQGGKIGECPTCRHMHLESYMIRDDHWAPKARWTRTWFERDEADQLVEMSRTTKLDADASMVRLVEKVSPKTGKHSGWKLEYLHQDVKMGIIVPEFRLAIEHCVKNEIFACAPLLDEKFIIRGNGRIRRKMVMHVFLPMSHMKHLFNLRVLPAGWEDMAIRVQLYGTWEHVVDATKKFKGHHLRTFYRVNEFRQNVYVRHEWIDIPEVEPYFHQYVDMTEEELSNLFD